MRIRNGLLVSAIPAAFVAGIVMEAEESPAMIPAVAAPLLASGLVASLPGPLGLAASTALSGSAVIVLTCRDHGRWTRPYWDMAGAFAAFGAVVWGATKLLNRTR